MSQPERSAATALRLAYADPPYPGRAHLYEGHSDYGGEVDHQDLLERLKTYDGWALSTSAESLHWLLPLCPKARVLAWVKHTVQVSWEPVLVMPARKPDGVRDWIQVEPDNYQWRERPGSYVIGQKPVAFCKWVFAWLGAEPVDSLVDLFPGSGNVTRAWEQWCVSPRLQLSLSPAAEQRAARRARAKDDAPSLLDEDAA